MRKGVWVGGLFYIPFLTVNLISQCNASRNRSLLTHPLKFFSSYTTWFVSLICGSVSVCTVYAGANQARAAVISRVSSERAGARFQVQSDPNLPGPDLPEPRFTGRIIFPRNKKLTVFHPDIPGTPIYQAKPFPPSISVNRGPTVTTNCRTIRINVSDLYLPPKCEGRIFLLGGWMFFFFQNCHFVFFAKWSFWPNLAVFWPS